MQFVLLALRGMISRPSSGHSRILQCTAAYDLGRHITPPHSKSSQSINEWSHPSKAPTAPQKVATVPSPARQMAFEGQPPLRVGHVPVVLLLSTIFWQRPFNLSSLPSPFGRPGPGPLRGRPPAGPSDSTLMQSTSASQPHPSIISVQYNVPTLHSSTASQAEQG
jgi:hypothetical protein